jgi:hypothetical protein
MANLLGQDIGLNYKGIITIGSTINQNVSASLQSLTDGDGNTLPLQLATGLVAVDGGTIAYTTGTNTRTVLSQTYTINATGGTNTVTGLKINATETAVLGTTHILMDLQVGGSSKLSIDRTGLITNIAGWFDNSGYTSRLYQNTLQLYTGNNLKGLVSGGGFTIDSKLIIGVSTTQTSRLHVRGDGTNPIIRFEDSAGTAQLSSDAAGAFTFAKVVTMDAAGLTVGANRMVVAPFASNQARMKIGDNGASSLMGAYGNNAPIIQFAAPTQGSMGGAVSMLVQFTHSYTSSAAGEYTHIQVDNTINHTGTGIDRLLYLKPTITSSPDFRAIDVLTGSTSAHKLIRLANAAGNKVLEVNAAQQIGLFGVTPIAQPTTAIANASTVAGGGAAIAEDSTFAGYTVAQIAQALVDIGILKP